MKTKGKRRRRVKKQENIHLNITIDEFKRECEAWDAEAGRYLAEIKRRHPELFL